MNKLLLLLLFPVIAHSQKIGAGLSLGYSSKQSLVYEFNTAYKLSNHVMLYPINWKIHIKMSDPTKPVIIESRVGYRVNSWELYGGYGYHIGKDVYNVKNFQSNSGFKPAIGLIKHIHKFTLITSLSGSVFSVGVGVFGVR